MPVAPCFFVRPKAAQHFGISMRYLPWRWFACPALLLVLGGCGAGPECDSTETRNAVLQAVSSDHNNALARYAAENPNTAKPGDQTAEAERAQQQPLYSLGEEIVTTSNSKDKRTLTCSGELSATVGATKASKDVTFTVQQAPDGKISVSVDPFRF